jgi:NAD(P)-dependent dehydrogenase (short-subunit alcohol dehydrogenase family)
MGKLDGKTAIITGGSSGIGLATAILFAQEGAKVVIAARQPERGRQAVQQVSVSGGQALFAACDVRKLEDCQNAVKTALDAFGRLDILFNNAGVIYVARTVENTSDQEWADTLDVNLTGAFFMSRCAIPRMAETGGGVIIHNASVFGLKAGGGVAAYCAAKGALVMLTKAMAIDHAAQNIRVNCLCPGSVDTPLLQNEMAALGGEDLMRPRFAARHLLNRISSPAEIARAVLFLASDDSSFITGAAIPVDGGRSAW